MPQNPQACVAGTAAERGRAHGARPRDLGAHMNLTQMRNLMLMYGCDTFVDAARKAGVTSQGFTKQIRAVERELGVPLFEADGAGRQVPTPYARILHDFCVQTLPAWDEALRQMERLHTDTREPLTVAVAAGTLSLLGIGFFDGFRDSHPHVELRCTNMSDLDAEDAVRAGTAQAAITVLPAEGFETRRLGTSRLYAWVPARHPLSARRELNMADLSGQAVALVGPNYKGYLGFLEICKREGIQPASVTPLSENSILHEFAREERGIAFTSEHLLQLFADDEAVVALPVRAAPVEVGLAWSRERSVTPGLVALIDYCRPAWESTASRSSWRLWTPSLR